MLRVQTPLRLALRRATQPTGARAAQVERHVLVKQQHRAFASGSDSNGPSNSSSPQPEKHWSGINTYYMSMRGLGIATRVVTRMPDFFRFYENDVFAKRLNDDARSAMFVLTQFPNATRIDLLEFRDAAEQLVHTVYEHIYAAQSAETTDTAGKDTGAEDPASYLQAITADAACAETLARKALNQAKRLGGDNKRAVLEQLNVNRVELARVDYKSVQLTPEDAAARGYDEEEWLEIQVQYDVTEHVQLTAVRGNGIDDRKTVNTTFTWTFESNVTLPENVDWQINDTTPFTETLALLTSANAAPASTGEPDNDNNNK